MRVDLCNGAAMEGKSNFLPEKAISVGATLYGGDLNLRWFLHQPSGLGTEKAVRNAKIFNELG